MKQKSPTLLLSYVYVLPNNVPGQRLLACLGSLSAVLGTSLLAVCNACGIQGTTDDVISGTGKVLDTAAADQYNTVLLQIVALAGNVGSNLNSVGQTDSGNLTQCRVRLLGRSGLDCRADAALLGRFILMAFF